MRYGIYALFYVFIHNWVESVNKNLIYKPERSRVRLYDTSWHSLGPGGMAICTCMQGDEDVGIAEV